MYSMWHDMRYLFNQYILYDYLSGITTALNNRSNFSWLAVKHFLMAGAGVPWVDLCFRVRGI